MPVAMRLKEETKVGRFRSLTMMMMYYIYPSHDYELFISVVL
jgi:hypothetical protein